MIPGHNYSMSPGGLLIDGVEPHRSRHHHGNNKPQFKNDTTATTDTCYCVPFM